MELKRVKTDALVIGGGLAGLTAALELRRNGWDVILVSKGKAGKSGNTIMTRNSLAAVLEEGPESGTVREHFEDTLAGGAYLNDQKLVSLFVSRAGAGIQQLVDWGIPFIRENDKIAVKGSPGHRRRRVITVDARHLRTTYTAGLAISLPLLERVKQAGVKTLDRFLVTRLLKKEGQVCGACGLDVGKSAAWVVESRIVILACGGAGQLFPLTTNAGDVSGDGYALGYQAGAKVRDMEFIQFHPTVTIGQGKEVLSTAPFGDGAVLRNSNGEAFMGRYSPEGDMAIRDVMARSIYMEVKNGGGTGRGGVYVDFGAVPREKMEREYALINGRLRGASMIEVGTAAHFIMGGIVINEGGWTGIPGLFACGEVAGGVHGANRLSGNALTEAVVFGLDTARNAVREKFAPCPMLDGQEIKEVFALDRISLHGFSGEAGHGEQDNSLLEMKKEMRSLMGLYAGIIRTVNGLEILGKRLADFQSILNEYAATNYPDLLTAQQLRLMVAAALLIAEAAGKRKESLGAHYIAQ